MKSSMFSDSLNIPFLHFSRLSMWPWYLCLASFNIIFFSISLTFCSGVIFSCWLMLKMTSDSVPIASSSMTMLETPPVSWLRDCYFISSILYLLMRLLFFNCSSSMWEKMPSPSFSFSHYRNSHFTMFGKFKSIMFLNKLLIKFLRSKPYWPVRCRN